ncbi:unnamed protein product [Bursaphelenchus okinawaensis]|uniref:N-acetylgalactosaminide beta-1,3-galactosyltransferase n=1 Tax=Bursaphelenchus okinawaensis TaxID=465554 RepID=A0A811L229_9BILA|nr:unnamed protein product [Bursaphelenchus okinawaensis]CAG9117286.1 unnamed protein product [Bursaphelenchus okinawaensis]
MTHPKNHRDKIPAANRTWMKHVDYVEVHTHTKMNESNIPYRTLYAGLKEDRSELWCKVKRSFQYAYLNVSKKFDWYIKIDDDTYVIADNLNKFLKTLDPNKPVFAGGRLAPFVKNGYVSGGIVILSRKTLELLVYNVFPHITTSCKQGELDDLELGKQLEKLEIYPIPTRDSDDKALFHIFTADETYHGYNDTRIDFGTYYKDKLRPGFEEFSKESIAFHHLTVNELYLFEILTYIVRKH